MSVQKRRNGYQIRWRDSAGLARSKQVTLYRDAIALDGELKRKKAMGELIAHERGTVCVAEFWDTWWTNYALVHLTPRTQVVYEALWRKHVAPALGRMKLRDVTQQHVAGLTSKLTQQLAPSSVRKCLAILQCVLERAVEWRYVASNAAKGVRKPRLTQREGRALNADELAALSKELDLRSRTIVAVLAGAGLRPGELRALRWSDATGAIVVTRAVSTDVIGPTKTNSKRQVELRPAVSRALMEWDLGSGRRSLGHDLVFPGRNGKVWTDQGWRMWQRRVFGPAAARAGLAGVVPYDLRHTFASTLIAEGRDIYWTARQLGHSPTMTLSTYGHLFEASYQGGSDEQHTNTELRPRRAS